VVRAGGRGRWPDRRCLIDCCGLPGHLHRRTPGALGHLVHRLEYKPMFVIFSVFYILIAAAMIVLILLQNGAGADAGSGFGGGASATVFGARGSSTFLPRATGVLAGLFFLLSLGMGIYLHANGAPQPAGGGLGVMAGSTEQPAPAAATPPAAGKAVPAATPAATNAAPAQSQGDVPPAKPSEPTKHWSNTPAQVAE